MKILALEFSSTQRSVAVQRADENEIIEVIESGPAGLRPLAMIKESLRRSHLEREQIDCLVVGIGPGSYTGIRTAIALAQGWEMTFGVRLLAISSAECLATQARWEGMVGRVNCVIDAQRREFYLAVYELTSAPSENLTGNSPKSITPPSVTGWHEIEPLHLVSQENLREREKLGGVLIGPEASLTFPSARTMYPRASTLAKLALGRDGYVSGRDLAPIYLREVSFVKAPLPRLPS